MGWLVSKIIIVILTLRVGTYLKIKILVIEVEKLVLIEVTISPFSVIKQMSSTLNFCFYLFCCSLKEKDSIRGKINSKKKNAHMWNQYYYYFDLPKIGVGQACTTKN